VAARWRWSPATASPWPAGKGPSRCKTSRVTCAAPGRTATRSVRTRRISKKRVRCDLCTRVRACA
jgi:hypothetical protein